MLCTRRSIKTPCDGPQASYLHCSYVGNSLDPDLQSWVKVCWQWWPLEDGPHPPFGGQIVDFQGRAQPLGLHVMESTSGFLCLQVVTNHASGGPAVPGGRSTAVVVAPQSHPPHRKRAQKMCSAPGIPARRRGIDPSFFARPLCDPMSPETLIPSRGSKSAGSGGHSKTPRTPLLGGKSLIFKVRLSYLSCTHWNRPLAFSAFKL